jgi:hypothetical protein
LSTPKCACGAPATFTSSIECATPLPLRDLHTGRFKKDPRKGKPKKLYFVDSCDAHACSKCIPLA